MATRCPATSKGRCRAGPAAWSASGMFSTRLRNQPNTGRNGYRFAERNEVVLAVQLRCCGAQADHAVVDQRIVGVASAAGRRGLQREQAHQDVAVARHAGVPDALQHVAGHFIEEHGERALRQHDQAPFRLLHEFFVQRVVARAVRRVELQVLRDVALHQRNGERSTDRMRPHDVRRECACAEQQRDGRQAQRYGARASGGDARRSCARELRRTRRARTRPGTRRRRVQSHSGAARHRAGAACTRSPASRSR